MTNKTEHQQKNVLKNWRPGYKHGDITAIAHISGYSKQRVSRYLNHAQGSPQLIDAVNAFYDRRRTNLKTFLEELI